MHGFVSEFCVSLSATQCCGSGHGSGSSIFCQGGSGSGFWWPKTGKHLQQKIFIMFWSKIVIYLFLGLHKGCPSYMRSLPQNRTSRTSKLEFSSLLWVILALLDPDPYSQCGSRSVFPIWIRIQLTKMKADPDQDPQHCCCCVFSRLLSNDSAWVPIPDILTGWFCYVVWFS